MTDRRREVAFWAVVGVGALLLQSTGSAFVWETVPLLAYAQFPWRMLTLLGVASVLLAAAGLAAVPPVARGPVALFLLALWLSASFGALRPALLDLRPDEISSGALGRIELERRLVGTTTAGEYTPRWVRRTTFEGVADPLPVGEGASPVGLISADRASIALEVAAAAGGTLVLDRYYFPGWVAQVDGRPAEVRPVGERGLLGVAVPAGAGQVSVAFASTPLRSAAAFVSAIAVAALIALALTSRGRLAAATVVLLLGAIAAPPPPTQAATLPMRADFDGGPRLLGATTERDGALTLYWTSTGIVDRGLTVALRLLDADGRVSGRRDKEPRFGLRPTTAWRPGAVVRDPQQIELLPGRPAGEYDLVLGLHDAAGYAAPTSGAVRWRDECPCAAPGPDGVGVRIGRIRVEAPRDRVAPALTRPGGAIVGGRVQLLDWDIAIRHAADSATWPPTWQVATGDPPARPLFDRLAARLTRARTSTARPPSNRAARRSGRRPRHTRIRRRSRGAPPLARAGRPP